MASGGETDGFPSSFDLELKFLPRTTLREHVKKLEDKCESEEFDTDEEHIRCYNLMSFFYWIDKQRNRAKEYNQKALTIDADNIIALSNRRHMLTEEKNKEAETYLRRLRKTAETYKTADGEMVNNPMLVAKAELAYSFATCGPKYGKKAAELYKSTIDQADGRADVSYWQFGYGLALKRLVHFKVLHEGADMKHMTTDLSEAADQLSDVAFTEKNQPRLRARAWVHLGEIANDINERIPNEKEKVLPRMIVRYSPADMFERAVHVFRSDVTVLEVCGKFYRFKNNDLSEKLLRESLAIRESAYAHHHLSKTLKAMLNAKSNHSFVAANKRKANTTKAYPGLAGAQRHNPNRNKTNTFAYTDRRPSSIMNSKLRPRFQANEQTTDIMHHLERAYDLSKGVVMLVDKALLQKELGNIEDAIYEFIQICVRWSAGQIENSSLGFTFEQLGMCFLHLKNMTRDQLAGQKYECKAKQYMKACLEASAAGVPKGTCSSVPLIMSPISNVKDTEESYTLSCLQKRISKFSESIDFAGKPWLAEKELYAEKIYQYLEMKDYDIALLLLNLQNCTNDTIESNLFLRSQLLGGIEAWRSGLMSLSAIRFQECVKFNRQMKHPSRHGEMPQYSNGDGLDEHYDFFIVCDYDDNAVSEVENFEMSLYQCLKLLCDARTLSLSEDFDHEDSDVADVFGYIKRSDCILIVMTSTSQSLFYRSIVDKVMKEVFPRKPSSVMLIQVDDGPVTEDLNGLSQIQVKSHIAVQKGDQVYHPKSHNTLGANRPSSHSTNISSMTQSTSRDDVDDIAEIFGNILDIGSSHDTASSRTTMHDEKITVDETSFGQVTSFEMIEWIGNLLAQLMNIEL